MDCIYKEHFRYYCGLKGFVHIHLLRHIHSELYAVLFLSHTIHTPHSRQGLFSILPKNTLACALEELGIEPLSFWLVDDWLYLLSHSRTIVVVAKIKSTYGKDIGMKNYFTFIKKLQRARGCRQSVRGHICSHKAKRLWPHASQTTNECGQSDWISNASICILGELKD